MNKNHNKNKTSKPEHLIKKNFRKTKIKVMCDVTRHNFEEILPRVQNCIQNCNFVAIDTEFSALSIDEAHSTRCAKIIEKNVFVYKFEFISKLNFFSVYLTTVPADIINYVTRLPKALFFNLVYQFLHKIQV